MKYTICIFVLAFACAGAVTDFRPQDNTDGRVKVEADAPVNVHIVFSNHLVRYSVVFQFIILLADNFLAASSFASWKLVGPSCYIDWSPILVTRNLRKGVNGLLVSCISSYRRIRLSMWCNLLGSEAYYTLHVTQDIGFDKDGRGGRDDDIINFNFEEHFPAAVSVLHDC